MSIYIFLLCVFICVCVVESAACPCVALSAFSSLTIANCFSLFPQMYLNIPQRAFLRGVHNETLNSIKVVQSLLIKLCCYYVQLMSNGVPPIPDEMLITSLAETAAWCCLVQALQYNLRVCQNVHAPPLAREKC